MTVDTESMRLFADAFEGVYQARSCRRTATDFICSAADEIDERRDSMAKMREDLDVYRQRDRDWIAKLAETKRELETEREAHGVAIKLNNELGKELDELRARQAKYDTLVNPARVAVEAMAERDQWKSLALERQDKLDEYHFSVHSPKKLVEENERLRERLESADGILQRLAQSIATDLRDDARNHFARYGGSRE